MPTITIDGQAYQANEGDNILQTCLSLGLDLPYFCWHPAMGSIGACRQCAVVQFQNEDDTRGRIVMGCMTPVTDGARFSLGGDKASTFRRHIVESLMLNHPHDCPVCAEGGECHLQDMTVMVGHRDRHYRGRKNTHRNQYLGPLIHHEMNRCITCYRCTRYYRDYAGGDDLAAMAAHDHIYFGRHREGILENEFAGNLVEVCPTGVFTDKALVHSYTRKWDLQSAPSICVGCAVGCNTMPGERYSNLKRIHNRFNVEVNGYFLCDRGRFGAGFVNSAQRLDYAGARNADGSYDAIQPQDALQQAGDCLQGSHKLAAIGSPRASLEANFLLQQLVGVNLCSPGFSEADHHLIPLALQLLHTSHARIASLQDIESADAVLVLGEDVTQTAPRIALALRQSVRNKAYSLAAELKLAPWQDAAVRNLAQDQRSPLDSFLSGDSKLDDIARHCRHCSPEDIAGHADAIAAAIRARASLKNASGALSKNAAGISSKDAAGTSSKDAAGTVSKHTIAEIAQSLINARRPLIVSGTGAQSDGVLEAAAAVTEALLTVNPATMLSLSVPECNSLGAAMLATDESPSIDNLAERAAAGDIDTLVILENDLSRRCSSQTQGLLFDNIPNIIALDALDNATVSRAAWVLPCTTFADGQGSFVSSEGRAQRHFPVFTPTPDRQPSWAWLLQLGSSAEIEAFADLQHFDDVSTACASAYNHLAKLGAAAPPHDFVNKGLKIPRQAHRYSGRTAIGSNVSVHEPQQATDAESALAYTMEGLNRDQGGSLLPFVWSPGWNSNQSVHKFQSEVAGPLTGGTAGVRLLDDAAAVRQPRRKSQPELEHSGPWLLIPRYRIFGSDELSAQSDSIAELAGNAYLELNPNDAQILGLSAGDGLCLGDNPAIEVHINSSLPDGCIGYTVGYSDTLALVAGARIFAKKAQDWVRPPAQLIGTDRGRSDV